MFSIYELRRETTDNKLIKPFSVTSNPLFVNCNIYKLVKEEKWF